MTDRELLQQALDALEAWDARGRLRIIEALRTRLDQPNKEWAGLTDEEIKNTRHHMVDGAYDYSFKQGAQQAEQMLKEKNAT